jgi:tetratricopeptide (TPR) repeat protein
MLCRCRLSRFLHKALCLLIVFTCPQVSAQVENGAITGQITVSRGSFPPERIKLTLQTRGIVVSEVWTDTEGKFLFRDLPSNLYHVSIADDKYELYEEEVKLEPRITPVNILSITLRPKVVVKDQVNSAFRGANPYLVDPASYERNFPKKAVREFERGAESQLKADYDDAIRHFQAALKFAPDFYPAHNDLGAIYVTRSRFPEAQAEFQAVLKFNQNDTQAYLNLGNVFLLTKRYEEALGMVREGLKREPNSGYGEFLLGSVYERQSRMLEAERALRDAVRLDPSISRAHLQLVNLFLREQRTQDAISELRVFLKRFPSDPLAAHASEVLQRLTSN